MVITNNQDIIEDFQIKDRCTTRKRRKNKHKERENMKNISKISWSAVRTKVDSDGKPYFTRVYYSGSRQFSRKQSNKVVRRYQKPVQCGGNYKKLFDFWWNIF